MKRLMLCLVVAPAMLLSASARCQTKEAPAAAGTAVSLGVSLDHVAINVRDLDLSFRFYAEVLGLQEIPAAAAGRKWMKIGNQLELHLLGGRTMALVDNRSVHVAFRCNDLDELIRRLDARAIEWGSFRGEKRVISAARTDGVRQIFFQDPDGYWLEVNDAGKLAR